MMLREYWNPEYERCGFVLHSGEIVEVPNISEDPLKSFEISQDDLTKYLPLSKSSWHTHTNEYSNLSLADYDMFLSFRELSHIIISKYRVVEFEVSEGNVFIKEVGEYENR